MKLCLETFRIGDRVRVKTGVQPSCGWGSVKSGDIGVVRKIQAKNLTVDFPQHKQWSGVDHEMERVFL